MSIKWKIMATCLVLVIVPVLTAGILSYRSLEREMYITIESKLKEQALMILNTVETAMQLTQRKVNSDLNVAHEKLYAHRSPQLDPNVTHSITARHQLTGETIRRDIPMMTINNQPVANNFEIVDTIQTLVGGTATIFQMIPEGALRISTNVLQSDGARAVGTYIPTDSPVYKTIMEGKTFYGRAYVVDAWYQTAYEPITDRDGKVIGMLYVGVKDASQRILDNLSRIVVGKTGYIWIINLQGEYVLSYQRQQDGEYIADAKDSDGRLFVQEWLRRAPTLQPGETVIDYYPWQNQGEQTARMKITAYTYFPEWEWLIGSSAYVEDFHDSLKNLRMITIGVSCVAILLGSVIAYLLAWLLITPLFKSIRFAAAIARGDMTAQMDIHRKDEIGILANALHTMQAKIRQVLQEIERVFQGVQSGKLEVRGNSHTFDGGWRQLIDGVNNVMEEIERSVTEVERQKAEVERQKAELDQQNWRKDGLGRLNAILAGDHSLVEICQTALSFVARYVNAGQGVLYTYHRDAEELRLLGSYAFTERNELSNRYNLGEGVIGQVAFERKPILLRHIDPEERLISTGTIRAAPSNTYTFPLMYNEELYGVLELASFEAFDPQKREFLTETNQIIATALFSAFQKEQMRELLRREDSDDHSF